MERLEADISTKGKVEPSFWFALLTCRKAWHSSPPFSNNLQTADVMSIQKESQH
jgi:hypothetical protein